MWCYSGIMLLPSIVLRACWFVPGALTIRSSATEQNPPEIRWQS